MRVSLLQIDVTGRSRAQGLQRIACAVDRAAAAAPAPDLIALPSGCDLIGVSARSVSRACLDGYRELLAIKAREWGLFLAAGVTVRTESVSRACAIVLDPDGDVVLSSGGLANAVDPPAPGTALWHSSVGTLGVVDPHLDDLPPGRQDGDGPTRLMIWPIGGALTGRRRAKLTVLREEAAVGMGSCWAVVVPACDTGDEHALVSFIKGARGETIASATDGSAAIVTAELSIESEDGG